MDKQALIEKIKSMKNNKGDWYDGQYNYHDETIDEILEVIESHPTIRPEIMEFAIEMEKEMARHDAEKGDSWKDEGLTRNFVMAIAYHWHNLERGYEHGDIEVMRHECSDIANYAMMIFHKAKGE